MSLSDVWQWTVAAFNLTKAVTTTTTTIVSAAPPGGPLTIPTITTLEGVTNFLNSDPRAKTLISLAQNLAGGQGATFVDAINAHDWSTVATDVLTEGLTVAAAFGVPGASFAIKLIPLVIWAAKHPADTMSPAMRKAAGAADNPYDHTGSAYPTAI